MGLPFFRVAAKRDLPSPSPRLLTGIVGSTPLYTPGGAIPAEHLTPGDHILSRSRQTAILQEIHLRDLSDAMIRIAPDTLGRARPEAFTLLPPDQRILLRQGAGARREGIFAARDLVDGDTVKWYTPRSPVRVVQLVFDSALIVYAGGLEIETAVAGGHSHD